MGMRAGRLRHRLSLQAPIRTQDAFGESTVKYSEYAVVWGSLMPGRGKEFEHAHQIHAEIDHEALIRYNPFVMPTHRVVFDGREFEIVSISNFEERNIRQVLMLKEIIND